MGLKRDKWYCLMEKASVNLYLTLSISESGKASEFLRDVKPLGLYNKAQAWFLSLGFSQSNGER